MGLKFKAEYENQTVVLSDGTMINKDSIGQQYIQEKIKSSEWLAYMLEETEAEKVEAEKPVVKKKSSK